MGKFVQENLNGIKELLFIGLDFLSRNRENFTEVDLIRYALIQKTNLLELGIEEAIIDEWFVEWRLGRK
jgi:hypothetical protein